MCQTVADKLNIQSGGYQYVFRSEKSEIKILQI